LFGQLENGLVEAVAVLISKMPRLRHESAVGNLGECFKSKPDFTKVYPNSAIHIDSLLHFLFSTFTPFFLRCFVCLFYRPGKNGGHKLLNWTAVHIGFSVIINKLVRA
jgi:hypothetical protein